MSNITTCIDSSRPRSAEDDKILEEKHGKGVKDTVQGFLDQGFTDATQIGKFIF